MINYNSGWYSFIYIKSINFNLNKIFNAILIDLLNFIYKILMYFNVYINYRGHYIIYLLNYIK